MPVYSVKVPNGEIYQINAPEGASEEDILGFAQASYAEKTSGVTSDISEPPEDPYANDSAWDFSGERNVFGAAKEFAKAPARGFINTILSSVEGSAELVDAATNAVGLDNLIDSGDENALVWAANAGKDWINKESGAKVDPRYQDLWSTKFGEGIGSFASFLTPSLALKVASGANKLRAGVEVAETLGKMTRAEKIATGAFATSSGAGEAAQRAKAAREEGLDVSQGEEDLATAAGALVGLTEMLPISRILGRVPKNIPRGEKDYLINLFKSAGVAAAEEGGQEVGAAILQNMIERGYNPNQEILEDSLMDDLTVGGAVGALADITLNAFAGRRKGYMSEAQIENERKAREIEARNDFQFRQEMAERKRISELVESDPDAFNAEGERVLASANTIPAPTNEEVMAFNQPSIAGAVATPETLGELYSLRIVGKLGNFFPTNTSFTVEQGEDIAAPVVGPDGTETAVPQPTFRVIDSTGKQYGESLTNPDVASSLARNLNGEIIGGSIRGSILSTLMTSPQGYNPEQATKLFRYGYQSLNPESNNVTYVALNDAAGTTTEKGYIEEVSHNDILSSPKKLFAPGKVGYEVTMPNGKKRIAVGLTASQELNLKREKAGLPPVNSFNIRDAREALGGNIGTLGNPSVTGIQDQLQYAPVSIGGKPAVASQAGEVLTKRKTTLGEKANAGFKQDGTSVLPDYIEFQSMEDAKKYADSLNKRKADKRFIPDALFEGKKNLYPEIKNLLNVKNIDAELDSDEVSQLVKAFTGARDAKSMSLEDQKLFYARLRNLPGFQTKTKLPVFRLRPYSPEQFVKATQYQQQNPGAVTDEGLASVLGLEPNSPRIAAIKSDLQKQTDARLQKEVLRDSRLPLVEGLRKALDDYGLSGVNLRLEESLRGPDGTVNEGYFDRMMDEVALAIDGIDPEFNTTDEGRLNYLKQVLSHEVVHALRALDLWTAKEWDILSQAAARTLRPKGSLGEGKTFLAYAQEMYSDMSADIQVEESIAELARAYIANKKLIGGKPRNLIERMIRLFQRLKAFVTNSGYQSFEAILNDMRSGAIASRDRSEIRSLRLTKNVPEGYVVAEDVPEGAETRTLSDFDEAALEGADIRESRKEVRYSRKPTGTSKDWAYSPLMNAVEQASPKITTAQQWSQWLDANASKLGVTRDEIDFSGIKDFLALKEGKVTKEDINGYLDNNGVVVKDVMKRAKDSEDEAISKYIENYIDNFPEDYPNASVINYPDGSIGVYADNAIYEGTPSDVAEEIGLNPDDAVLERFPKEVKFEQYTLPGGENYRELLLTLPFREPSMPKGYEVTEMVYDDGSVRYFANTPTTRSKGYSSRIDAETELKRMSEGLKDFRKNLVSFKSSHFDEPNILAHIRMNDRTDADGNKVLFIEEIQSDWAQEGRKEGFAKGDLKPVRVFNKTNNQEVARFNSGLEAEKYISENDPQMNYLEYEQDNGKKAGIPTAPFVTETKNWVALALKRILALAGNEGYNKVAFINGEQSADRYDLSKQISAIAYSGTNLKAYDLNGKEVISQTGVREESLSDYIGKEAAERLLSQPKRGTLRTLEGVDLKVGGQGMKSFYDQIVPQVAKEVIKKVGGKNLTNVRVSVDESPGETAYQVVLPNGNVLKTTPSKKNAEALAASYDGATVRYVTELMSDNIGIEITPEMATRIAAGQRLFSRKAVPGTSQALPDTIEVDGVQRPTKNNLGKQIHPTEEGVRNFWSWFGDSKMVDEQGRPKVVYHGTNKEFYTFDPNATGGGGFHPEFGFFFGEQESAEWYADNHVRKAGGKANVIPAYLSIQNPKMMELDEFYQIGKDKKSKEKKKEFLSQGYDGVLATGKWSNTNDEYVVFGQGQIKYATDNIGTYDQTNPDIRYSRKNLQGEPRVLPTPEQVAPEPRSQETLAEAVAKVAKDTERTPKTSVPLYGPNASPEALYVALNPEMGAKFDLEDTIRYSRRGNEPTYSPAAQVLIDQTPQAPNETMGETLVNTMKLGPLRDGVDIFRQAIVFKGARLERQYKENPELARLMADSSALTAYEMMDHSRSMTQAALTNGVPVYVNGGFKVVPFVHKGKTIERGFLEVMAPLNNDKLHGNLERLAHRYAMAVRGERLNAEGKLTPVAPGELAILKAEIQKYRNPETGRPVIEEWYEMWQDYNSYIVKFLRDTGVVDESGAELWLKQADYVPFYREDNQGNLVHPKVFGGLHTASQFKSVGKSSEDLNIDMVTAIVNNIDAAIAMGMKNVAQQRVIRDQINIGLASILKKGETVGDRNSVSFKIAGKRYTAIIEDPLIYQSMLPSNEIGMDNLFGKMLRIPASILRELIIRDPGYMVANMFRDTLSTYVTTGAEVVPLWGTAKGFAGDIQKLRNLGVLGGYDLRLDKFGVRKFYDKEAKRMGMVAGLNWINPISTAWDLMGRISERSEAATRLAVYEDVLKRTGNQVEAQYQALSVMNYGRRGNNALFRALTAVVPFLNARVQGLDKLYQAGTGRVGAQYKTDTAGNVIPDAQRRKNFARFVYRAGLITAVSAMYYAMVSDDDEYLNASPEIRDNYYILPIMKGDIESGKPGLSARLPIPFEVGILFKVIPERLLAGIYGDDTSKDFKDSMRRAVVSTLGINPTPQAVLPIAEALVNKDFYSGRPIVPTYMENLLPEQQKTFYTNQLAESVANSIGASPMKIQHLMQGYGGTLGGYFLQAIDSMARENEMVLPSTQWFQKPFIKRFFTTANQPGLQNKFYELKDDVDGMTQTINRLQKDGRYDELAAFYAKNGHMYEMRTDLNYLEKQITMLREQRKVIEQMDIDPESKREAIEQINMMISATLISVPMYRQMAYDKE